MPTLTRTHTRTHVHITFADPYKTCNQCGAWVEVFHDATRCGCGEGADHDFLVPCEHHATYTDVCASWGPVDGCRCARYGWTHPIPPNPAEGAVL